MSPFFFLSSAILQLQLHRHVHVCGCTIINGRYVLLKRNSSKAHGGINVHLHRKRGRKKKKNCANTSGCVNASASEEVIGNAFLYWLASTLQMEITFSQTGLGRF